MKRILPLVVCLTVSLAGTLAWAQSDPTEEGRLKESEEQRLKEQALRDQQRFAEQELEEAKKKAALGQGPIGVPGVSPPLKFDEPVKDLGKVSDDDPVRIVFTFTNTSDKPVKITNLSASCGCTVPTKLPKELYAPGEKGEVAATFNPTGRRGKEVKHVFVDTDYVQSPRAELVFSVETQPRVLVEPQNVFMNEAMPGEPRSQVVSISGREPGFDVTDMRLADNSPHFKVTRLDRTEVKEIDGSVMTRVRYQVDLSPALPMGQYQAGLTASTTDSRRPNITFQARANVVGTIRTMPDRVWLMSQQPNVPWAREFTIEHRRGAPFNITSIESVDAPKDLRMVFDLVPGQSPSEPGGRWILKVSGTVPSASGVLTGKIVLRTTASDMSVIEIPVQGNLQFGDAPQ